MITTLQQSTLSDKDKFNALNIFIFENLHKRPRDIFIPIFVPITPQSFQAHPALIDDIKKIELPSQKTLQAPQVSRALMGVVDTWNKETKIKAFLDSEGTLGSLEVD